METTEALAASVLFWARFLGLEPAKRNRPTVLRENRPTILAWAWRLLFRGRHNG